MPAAIPRASRLQPPRWPPSPSNATRSMARGTTPSHPTSSRHEAVIPRQILSVWSRDEVVRVDLEGCRVLCTGLADGLEGGSPSEPLEVLGEVVGRDKGQDVSFQALRSG